MKDEVTADDLAADAAASAGSNAMVLTQLEERMCALRIIVYTPNGKAIVLSAPTYKLGETKGSGGGSSGGKKKGLFGMFKK